MSALGYELSQRAKANLVALAQEHLRHADRNLQDDDLFNCAEHIARASHTIADTITDPAERRAFIEACVNDPEVCRECRTPNIDNEGFDGLCGNCADRAERERGDG